MSEGNCMTCSKPNTGRYWCKNCDSTNPSIWVDRHNIDSDIKELIMSSVQKAENYDDPFIEYIPYQKLEILKKIGEGGNGTVYNANWRDGLRYVQGGRFREPVIEVAVKEIKRENNIPYDILSKIKAHSSLNGETDRLLRVHGVSKNPTTGNLVIVMDCKKDNLRQYLDNNFKTCKWRNLVEILYGISRNLRKIHTAGFIHGDLHSRNVLLNGLDVYITGFGFSSNDTNPSTGKNRTVIYGILPYIAPEVLCGNPRTKESDVYSFGVVMTEMITGKPPFYDRPHDENLARQICEKGLRPEINNDVAPGIYTELARLCLDADPAKRPTFETLEGKFQFWFHALNNLGGYPTRGPEIVMCNGVFGQCDNSRESKYERHPEARYIGRTLSFGSCSGPNPANFDI